MRKNLIAMSVATLVAGLGMAGGAAANVLLDTSPFSPSNATVQVVRPGGIGHKLLIPYFNVQSGNATLINIVNTDAVNGKAVKVRFRGASNSDDLFDFQVYLSPNDVWTANVSRGADGRAMLTTPDNSCTIPAKANLSGQSFVTDRLPASFTPENRAAQTREGYIEIFNMADIPPRAISIVADATFGTPLAGANALFTAIKHVNGVPPCTTATMNTLVFDPANLSEAFTLGFRAPTGTLFGNWTIINVPKSGASTGEATAMVATIATNPDGPSARGNIVFFPQTSNAIATGVVNQFTADPSLRTATGVVAGLQTSPTVGDAVNSVYGTASPAGNPTTGKTLPIIAALSFDLPDLSTPYLSNQFPLTPASPIFEAESLTRAISTVAIINEFLTDTTITAFTDWVFSMPTRRYSVAVDYRGATSTVPPTMAFTRFANRDYYTLGNSAITNFQVCVDPNPAPGVFGQTVTYWDREENTPSAPPVGFVISPGTAPPVTVFRLCGENSVLTFNSIGTPPASVLGAEIAAQNLATASGGLAFRDGWALVRTTGLTTGQALNQPAGVTGAGLATGNGLPIVGKSFVIATNPAAVLAAGGAANFGGSWEHRTVRPVTP